MKKTLKIVGNVLLWVFIVLALIIMIATIIGTAAKGKDGKGIPSLFGKNFIAVQSDSMSPTFKKGNMIIGTALKDEEKAKLKVGDVITFRADLIKDIKGEELNSHRIIAILDSKHNVIKDASGNPVTEAPEEYWKKDIVFYKTKGDNNSLEDAEPVSYADVVSVWHGEKNAKKHDPVIWGLGSVTTFLQSSVGFLIVVVIPCAIFFIFELISLIKVIMENKQKKMLANMSAGEIALDEEEIKRKAIEEYIKSQQGSNVAPANENVENKSSNAENDAKDDNKSEDNKSLNAENAVNDVDDKKDKV